MNHADLIADFVHDMIHGGNRVAGIFVQLCDDFFNIFSGLFGLLGEHADLLRDNSEPPACFPCARCFYRGVQGEKIGLCGNLLDNADNF